MTQFTWPRVISKLLAGESLDESESAAAMGEIMEGAASPAQIAGFVVALRAKGETAAEIAGLVATMRRYAVKVRVGYEVVDTCGTGGDRAGTFNVSTAAALVCAGAGVKVAKHGNRAASSRCGSADVLESLGVRIDLPPDGVVACIESAGIGFCFAPMFHPALRHAGLPRRELGIPTIFNFLGPLTNPAGATRQALGVSDPRMLDKMVDVLRRLGSSRVLGFHGAGGLDELSTLGLSRVVELRDGAVHEWTLDPRSLGLEEVSRDAISGGTCDENAQAIRRVLAGDAGPHRDIVLLNAAAGIVAAGVADDFTAALDAAADAVDSGRAAAALDTLVATSHAA